MSTVTVKFVGTVGIQLSGSIRLSPGGSHLLERAEAVKLLQHPHAAQLVAAGLLICPELVEKPAPAVTEETVELSELNARDAIEVAEACTSVPQLDVWYGAERRVTVQRAITARIVELEEG